LTTFLNELDGVGGSAGSRGVLVLAATNRPLSGLDAALLRPGRLHESLEVNANTP
jgi:ATP-dependent 26S proteasome regulatory subunit